MSLVKIEMGKLILQQVILNCRLHIIISQYAFVSYARKLFIDE